MYSIDLGSNRYQGYVSQSRAQPPPCPRPLWNCPKPPLTAQSRQTSSTTLGTTPAEHPLYVNIPNSYAEAVRLPTQSTPWSSNAKNTQQCW